MTDGLRVIRVEQQDPRLGRNAVLDDQSWDYQWESPVPRRAIVRRNKAHRIIDPRPNPNQPRGNCTCCAECMLANAVGNRVPGVVLGMGTADKMYGWATRNDPFPGQWEPTDTGSDGLSAAKAAVALGVGESYEWHMGIDAVLDGLQFHPISIGTWFYFDMFHPDPKTLRVRPTGGKAGGHQYLLRAHDVSASKTIGKQIVECLTWWGDIRYFRMTVDDFAGLLADDGDAHFTRRRVASSPAASPAPPEPQR